MVSGGGGGGGALNGWAALGGGLYDRDVPGSRYKPLTKAPLTLKNMAQLGSVELR